MSRYGISQIGDGAIPPTGSGKIAASTKLERGQLVAFNASGYLVAASALTTLTCAGLAYEDYDNSSGADGAATIRLIQATVELDMGTSSDDLTSSVPGCACWMIDTHTVGATDGTASRSLAGIFLGISNDNAKKAVVWIGPAAVAAAKGLQDSGATVDQMGADKLLNSMAIHVRGIVDANVASLSGFTGVTGGTAVNGVTYVAGDIVLLVKQTTVAQNGPYVVGTVSGGAAPLTRPSWWAAAAAIPEGATFEVGIEDTAYPGSTWKTLCVSGKVVDTDDPILYPRVCKGIGTLVLGVLTLGSTQKLWLKSVTTSVVHATLNTPNTNSATTGGYKSLSADMTAGVIGTAAAKIKANVLADDSTNTADVSTVNWSVHNW